MKLEKKYYLQKQPYGEHLKNPPDQSTGTKFLSEQN